MAVVADIERMYICGDAKKKVYANARDRPIQPNRSMLTISNRITGAEILISSKLLANDTFGSYVLFGCLFWPANKLL